MSVILLDPTVVSPLHPKKRRSEILARYAVHMESQTLALSFQRVAELWNWAEAREWGDEARNGLDLFIKRFLVIPYDYALARAWARAMQSSREARPPVRFRGLLDCSHGNSPTDSSADA